MKDDVNLDVQRIVRFFALVIAGVVLLMVLPVGLRALWSLVQMVEQPLTLPGNLDAEKIRLAVWAVAGALVVGAAIRLIRRI